MGGKISQHAFLSSDLMVLELHYGQKERREEVGVNLGQSRSPENLTAHPQGAFSVSR